jgi:hypothetical protein
MGLRPSQGAPPATKAYGGRYGSSRIKRGKGREWCARRDSNSRPNAPEAFALSS